MATKRRRILEACIARLNEISRANGYETDAGAAIFLGVVPELGPDDPAEAIAILPEDDRVTWQGEHAHLVWPIQVAGLAPASSDEAWLVVEAIVGDIKRALELEDRALSRLLVRPGIDRRSTRVVPREAGSMTVGAAVTYENSYTEQWGRP